MRVILPSLGSVFSFTTLAEVCYGFLKEILGVVGVVDAVAVILKYEHVVEDSTDNIFSEVAYYRMPVVECACTLKQLIQIGQ